MQEQKNLCALCSYVAEQRCSSCQAEYYCSKEHQKSHWKIHSKNCRAYKLVENSQLGRYYIAKRNIKIGETVMYDKAPLITAPGYMRAIKEGNSNFSVSLKAPPVCLSCYDQLTAVNAKPCGKCGWPLCYRCTKHGTECEFTKKHRKSKVNITVEEYGHPHPAYEVIGVIRALALREDDPKSYQKLMDLQDLQTSFVELDSENSIGKAAQFAKTFLKIENIQEAEICKIIRIIMLFHCRKILKFYSVKLPDEVCQMLQSPGIQQSSDQSSKFLNDLTNMNSLKITTMDHEHAAVYCHSSRIEHNCRPNCSRTTTDDGGVIFWAAVPISKGDHITTTYVKPFWGTRLRRQSLTVKFIDCICERCKDPTEFGTMFNAIKCTKDDCNGYALPPTFLVTEENYADYICRKCNNTVPRTWTDNMEQRITTQKAALMTSNVWLSQYFIEEWKAHLHENNSYIFDTELDMAMTFAYGLSGLSNKSKEYLADIVKLCTKLTELLRVLAPAEHTIRATVLYLKVEVTMLIDPVWTLSEQRDLSKKFQKDLSEAERLLSREPVCHPFEYSMLLSIRKYLVKLKMFDDMPLELYGIHTVRH